MKKYLVFVLLALTFILNTNSYASWLIYHKPEFKGMVIDAETKEPIEGAVVVAVYYKVTYMAIIESNSVVAKGNTPRKLCQK